MKIFKILSMVTIISIAFSVSGCCCWGTSCKVPECKPEIKIVTKYKKIYVPVNKKLVLDHPVPCNFKGTGFQPTIGLIECVSVQKKLIQEAYDFNITKDTNTTLDTILR